MAKKRRKQICTPWNGLSRNGFKRIIDPVTGIPKFATGRPLKFTSVKHILEIGQQYFKSCWQEEKTIKKDGTVKIRLVQHRPYTMSGLALALGMERITLLDYEQNHSGTSKGKKYSYAIKYLKSVCQRYAEEKTFGPNASGPIFNLTNNYARWYNKSNQEISGPGGKPIPTLNTNVDMSAEEATRLYMEEIKG